MNADEHALAAEVSRLLEPRRPGWAADLARRGLLLCSVAFYPSHVAVLCNTSLASFFAPLGTSPETLAFQLNAAIDRALPPDDVARSRRTVEPPPARSSTRVA